LSSLQLKLNQATISLIVSSDKKINTLIMIKQILLSTIVFVFFSFLVINTSSCSKERVESQDELNSYEPIDDYLNEKKEDEQEFVIDTSGTGPIIGHDSTQIWISKELLMFPDSSDVDWPFTVKLVELYSAKEMIYYQMPTVSQGKIMETDGEIRVRAFKQDSTGVWQELLLKVDRTLRVDMPSDSIRENMEVFYGSGTDENPDWTTNVTSLGGNSGDLEFFSTSTGYMAHIGKLGWINCGKTHLGSNDLTFTSATDHLENTGIFTYIPKYQSVLQARDLHSGGIPDSSDVKIVVMARNSSNELYSSYLQSTINSDGSVPIILEPISDAQLTSILDNL